MNLSHSIVHTISILIRGELGRWGCSLRAHEHQKAVLQSIDDHIAKPLLPLRSKGYLLVSLTSEELTCAVWKHYEIQQQWKYITLQHLEFKRTSSQQHSAQIAISFMSRRLAGTTVVFTRADLYLKTPISMWGCSVKHGGAIGVSQHVVVNPLNRVRSANESNDVINDVLFVIPSAFVTTFDFKECRPNGNFHSCEKTLSSIAPLEFCWPRNTKLVRCPNKYYVRTAAVQ